MPRPNLFPRPLRTLESIFKARFDTLALRAGAAPDSAIGARVTLIHLSTSLVFRDSGHTASLFNMEHAGHTYSHISDPTAAAFEERIVVLENGVGAIATVSGQTALRLAAAMLVGVGSHIAASSALYGGSHDLLYYMLCHFGIEAAFVKPGNTGGWCSAIHPDTRLLFGGTLGNPELDVLDIPIIASIAYGTGVPLLVDSISTTLWLLQPFAHGVDSVYHSAAKSLGECGTTIGDVLVDRGTFDCIAAGKHPELIEPYAGFHDMVFTEEGIATPFLLHAHCEGLRDFGTCMSSMAAWQLLQDIEALPLRMARYVDNARRIVAFLAGHPMAASAIYPEFEPYPDHAPAKRLLPQDCGVAFSLDLRGDRRAGQQFIGSLGLFSHLVNVGDARSLVIRPASTTHFHMDADTLVAADISEGTIRLSIGLEDADDLTGDLKRGLKAAERAMSVAPGKVGASATGAR